MIKIIDRMETIFAHGLAYSLIFGFMIFVTAIICYIDSLCNIILNIV